MICEKFDGKSVTLKRDDILNIESKIGKLNMINPDITKIILQHLLLRYHE